MFNFGILSWIIFMPGNILIVDDEDKLRSLLGRII